MGWSSSSWLFFLFFVIHSHQSAILSSLLPSPPPLCHPTESSALLQFKYSFSINQNIPYFNKIIVYPNTVSWKNGTDCCSWEGVLCDRISGHVIGLNLSSSGLQGPFYSNSSVFSLRHLQSLNLNFNDFCGSPIPPEFGCFVNLKWLSVNNANFSGYVPLQLSHLSKLCHLTLRSTTICWGGPLCSVYQLKLETDVFKRMLQNMTNLRELTLYLDMSKINTVTCLMNISSSLMVLELGGCELQGILLEHVLRLPNLYQLDLRNNNLRGSLPTFNWSSPLRYLSLSSTSISIDLSYLSTRAKSLRTLYLSNCSFRGSYPAMLSKLTQLSQLTSLDLSYKNFGGQIPWSYLNLQQLISLSLSGNNFIGQIPEIFMKNSNQIPLPKQLKSLKLSSNLLSGSIPSWIYSLPFLQELFLQRNQLTGPVKEFQSQSLEILDLHLNKLHGQIPSSVFQQSNLYQLDLSYNNLSGFLKLSQFSKLKNLQTLDVSFNYFSLSLNSYSDNNHFLQLKQLGLASCNISSFPYFLRNLERLNELQLSHNQIRGRIPEWLLNEGPRSLNYLNLSHNFLTHIERIPLENLKYLDLRSNMLRGNLPIVPPSLIMVVISNNHLSGKIPSLYCQCSELEILDLSNNNFHGNIPSCLGNLRSLSVLDLQMNKFNGIIPDMFENTTQLRSLHLKGNQFEGLLPRSWHNCKGLEVLDVGNNKINDNFPNWLEDLPMLQVLVLKSNRFHGSIGNPKVKSPFQKLQIMDLSDNDFNGLLPTKYFENFMAMMEGHPNSSITHIGDYYYQDSVILVVKGSKLLLEKIISIFATLDFSKNNFEGEIPESIGKLRSLKGLNFSRNKLTDSIPSSLRNLTNLEGLDLSSNMLVGKIPWQMTDLTQLSHLNLSHNKFVGPIPKGKQFDTFNNDSYSGNLGLCGFPLSKSCSNGETQQEGDHDEKHTDENFDWKIVMMGYGCGTIIGISIGYIVLFSRRFDYWLRKKLGGGRGRGRRCKTNARLRRRRRSN